jgi:two-component system CheB/CheR fusion protein
MSEVAGSEPKPAGSQTSQSPQDPRLIVGAGASAGGFEAFKALLEALPERTGLAFVFIQHLDPGHESLMAELLARFTRMKLQQVQAATRVEADHVYVAPPNTNLLIVNGVLNVRPVEQPPGRHKTIDFFLRSLAADQGAQGIGVLLSGTGSDGVLGLKAIKGEGGITLVQDEKSARFSSMPMAAVKAEVADFVLPPAGIAQELMRIKEQSHAVAAPSRAKRSLEREDQSEVMDKILGLVWNATNVDFSCYKPNTLRRRVMRRMLLRRFSESSEYLRFLENNPAEVVALYQDLVINVTSFFRDPEVFDALKRAVFPEIVARKASNSTIRIWVPGCSTGEEVYSIAIALTEFLHHQPAPIPIQLFGTDISENAIDRARTGIYPENIEADVAPERLRLYFVKRDGGYQISKPIRDLCIFAGQNLVRDPPFSNLDLISCRNVLIYFGQELQNRVFPLFHYALNDTGFLLLGSAESITSAVDYFDMVDSKHRIFIKKPASVHRILDFAHNRNKQRRSHPPRIGGFELTVKYDPAREADLMLLDQFTPASVLVDSALNILQFRGSSEAYLQPSAGPASLNLLKMAREGLVLALHSAIQEAATHHAPVDRRNVRFRSNGGFALIDIKVLPFANPRDPLAKFYLVLFLNEGRRTAKAQADPASSAARSSEDARMQRLQRELETTQECLKSVYGTQEASNQELRSANEEILSSNEELQSTNEELETAKEELQSSNEELTTFNDELQIRNAELAKVNDDLNNLLSSVHMGIVMVDHELRIRRFTSLSAQLMNLLPTDIGRPLGDINPRIAAPDLTAHTRTVIDTLTPQTINVRDAQGIEYRLAIRPYRTEDNRIDGALVMISSLDVATKEEPGPAPLGARLQPLLDLVHEPLLLLTDELRLMRGNAAFFKMFGLEHKDDRQLSLFELAEGRLDVPALRRLLAPALTADGACRSEVVELDQPAGKRELQISVRRLVEASGALIVMAIAAC